MSSPHPRRQEQVEMFVQQGLVLLVASTKLLQELVGELEDLHHLGIPLRRGQRRNVQS